MLNLSTKEFSDLRMYLNGEIIACKRTLEAHENDYKDGRTERWMQILKRKIEKLTPITEKVNEEWESEKFNIRIKSE